MSRISRFKWAGFVGIFLLVGGISTVSAAEVTSNYDDVTLIPENSFTDKYLIHFHGD
ncbi:MAG: hypothetical protein IMY71_15915 [Bacteroidetes bacterium]|nr:hypothetical protein [Bacteroidota bacterium]